MISRRLLLSILVASVLWASAPIGGAYAQAPPQFRLGFAALASMIPAVVGAPLENEWHNAVNGDGLQRTTTGLMVWRKLDNWTAFTDGYRTWVNGPLGLQTRLNEERFAWEEAPFAGASRPGTATGGPAGSPPPQVASWAASFPDDKLRDALSMAYSYAPDWRAYPNRTSERAVTVGWGDLPSDVGGMTKTLYAGGVWHATITLNSRISREPTQVAASVLAHEIYHAATADTIAGTESCYANEVSAFGWESYVWSQLPRPDVTSSYTRFEDRLAQVARDGQLDSYVRDNVDYQAQCTANRSGRGG